MMYYKSTNPEIKCANCYDTGFLFVIDPEVVSSILMRCHCEVGAQTKSEWIPFWKFEAASLFPRQIFPVQDFKPKIQNSDSDRIIADKIFETMAWWKSKIQFSENYWREMINKHKNKTA